MLNNIKQWFKSFFTLSKSIQRGILFSIFLIIILIIINLLLPYMVKNTYTDFSEFKSEIEEFRKSQQTIADSIRIEQLQNRGELDEVLAKQKLKPFPFNPNMLPEEAWAELGLSEKQIQTIKNYEAKGGKFRKKEDLKKMYCISEAEYNILESFIRIPSEFKSKPSPSKSKPIKKKIRYLTLEINSADSSALVNSLNIAPWIAKRVVNYRNILGGFSKAQQLKEVYGFDATFYNKIEKYITLDTSLIIKININTSSFKEILRHPYISYDITKEIVNQRKKEGTYGSTVRLIELGILSESLFIKLEPYLSVNQ